MGEPGPDPLSSEKMQLFVAGLSGMPPEEVRKAKVLYIRNAISEYKAARAGQQTLQRKFFGGCLGFLPPGKSFFREIGDQNLRLKEERIRNAMDVWREDLKGEHFDL